MKKFILLSLLVLTAFFSFANDRNPSIYSGADTSFPNYQKFGSSVTLTDFPGAPRGVKGVITGYYADTTTANNVLLGNYIKFYPFAEIYTTNPANTKWVRDITTSRWLVSGGAGTGSIVNIYNNSIVGYTLINGDSCVVPTTGSGLAIDTICFNFVVCSVDFLNDSTFLACSCDSIPVCDTGNFTPTPLYIFQNGLIQIRAGVVEQGGNFVHNTDIILNNRVVTYTDTSGGVVLRMSGAADKVWANTFESQNLSTDGNPQTSITGGLLSLFNNAVIQGYQQPIFLRKGYPFVGAPYGAIFTNDTLNTGGLDSADYTIADFRLKGWPSGVETSKFKIYGNGELNASAYPNTRNDGSVTKVLSTDVNGNVILGTVAGGVSAANNGLVLNSSSVVGLDSNGVNPLSRNASVDANYKNFSVTKIGTGHLRAGTNGNYSYHLFDSTYNETGVVVGSNFATIGTSQNIYYNLIAQKGSDASSIQGFDDSVLFSQTLGKYRFSNVASGAATDSVMVISPSGYIFKRNATAILNGGGIGGFEDSVANVRDYGAVGDGVTDDAAAITNAIATGRTVYFPKGTYFVGSQLTPAVKGQTFWGDGQSSQLTCTSTTQTILKLNKDSCRVIGLSFYGTGKGSALPGWTTSTTQNGVWIDAYSCSVMNSFFKKLNGRGVYVFDPSAAVIDKAIISGNYFDNCTAAIETDYGADYVLINDNQISNCYAGTIEGGNANVNYGNCSIKDGNYGMYFRSSNLHGTATNMLLNHHSVAGLTILDAHSSQGFLFTNCTFYFSNINLGATDTVKSVTFMNCMIASATINATKVTNSRMIGGYWFPTITTNGSGLSYEHIINSVGRPQFLLDTAQRHTYAGAYKFALYDTTNRVLAYTDADSGPVITADNGLTKNSATNVQLGGALIQSTTITQSTNPIIFTSANVSGTTTTSSQVFNNNSLTTGTGLYVASSSLSSGSLIDVAVASTAAASNTQKGINVAISGANSNSSQTTYGIYSSNTHTGTGSDNIGIYGTASGGGDNTGVKGNGVRGVAGVNSVNGGYALEGTANFASSIALYAHTTTGLAGRFEISPASTNTTVTVAQFQRQTSGAPGNGIGAALDLQNEASDNNVYTSSSVISTWTDVTVGTRTGDLQFWTTNSATPTKWMTIAGNGAIQWNAYGAGTITADAGGNLTSVSDERLKNISGYYKGGLNELMNINPIVYKWNNKSGLERNHNYIGFSAQNIQAALGNDAVGINAQGYMSIQDRAIMATMVRAIQEQQLEIEQLKKMIQKK